VKRVLFVDDETRVLDGLKRMLHKHRNLWDMVFVSSGQAALDELAKSAFDVLVSDMRMPQMDGAALLAVVQEKYPEVVRIVLSGHTEMEAALRTVPVAHQFLSKPCSPEQLLEVIKRAAGLKDLLADATLQHTIGQIKHLPAFPRTYQALLAALHNPNAGMKEIAGIVGKDVGLCAKLLQLVNSAFFGLSRRVTSIETAVSLLGTNMVKNIVLSLEVFRGTGGQHRPFSTDILQQHCFFAGTVARSLVKDPREADDAFAAGVLHDLGEMILLTGLPDLFGEIVRRSTEAKMGRHAVEIEKMGVTHAEVGAYLLGLWGLPYCIMEAVAYHHHPRDVDGGHIRVLAAVHVADRLLQETQLGDQMAEETPGEIHPACLEALGGAAQLPEWRKLVQEQQAAIKKEMVGAG
jgi:HD-like signal output (HDOD) protein/CheY-like chemotaxis protein